MISEFVKKIKDGKIKIEVSKTPYRGKYHRYGSLKSLDKLVDSEKVIDRIKAIRMGYGIEKLMDDTNPRVLQELIKFGGI